MLGPFKRLQIGSLALGLLIPGLLTAGTRWELCLGHLSAMAQHHKASGASETDSATAFDELRTFWRKKFKSSHLGRSSRTAIASSQSSRFAQNAVGRRIEALLFEYYGKIFDGAAEQDADTSNSTIIGHSFKAPQALRFLESTRDHSLAVNSQFREAQNFLNRMKTRIIFAAPFLGITSAAVALLSLGHYSSNSFLAFLFISFGTVWFLHGSYVTGGAFIEETMRGLLSISFAPRAHLDRILKPFAQAQTGGWMYFSQDILLPSDVVERLWAGSELTDSDLLRIWMLQREPVSPRLRTRPDGLSQPSLQDSSMLWEAQKLLPKAQWVRVDILADLEAQDGPQLLSFLRFTKKPTRYPSYRRMPETSPVRTSAFEPVLAPENGGSR